MSRSVSYLAAGGELEFPCLCQNYSPASTASTASSIEVRVPNAFRLDHNQNHAPRSSMIYRSPSRRYSPLACFLGFDFDGMFYGTASAASGFSMFSRETRETLFLLL
jgi:hypothetical protein